MSSKEEPQHEAAAHTPLTAVLYNFEGIQMLTLYERDGTIWMEYHNIGSLQATMESFNEFVKQCAPTLAAEVERLKLELENANKSIAAGGRALDKLSSRSLAADNLALRAEVERLKENHTGLIKGYNSLSDENIEQAEQLKACRAEQWISIKDKTPDFGKWVLVFSWRGPIIASYFKNKFYALQIDQPGIRMQISDVTHWMPLPNPPKQ